MDSILHQRYINYSCNFSYGLYELSLRKDDKIITISSNRPEWNFCDMGMAMIGVIHVPVFTSLSVSDSEYIISNSGAKIYLVSEKRLLKYFSKAANFDPANVYTFDKIEGFNSWKEIVSKGENSPPGTRSEVKKIMEQIKHEDIATLIYTSGTTGRSKGVMLSHRNLVSNFLATADVFKLKPEDKSCRYVMLAAGLGITRPNIQEPGFITRKIWVLSPQICRK